MSGILGTMKKFPKVFWVANTIEIFERIAWYGLFAVLALYLTGSTDEGALGFTQIQKGAMMGTVTAVLYFLPLITGAIADRVGYRTMLIIAFLIYGSGLVLMGSLTEYYAVYAAFLMVALGAALFKPVISATVTKTTNDETSSIGFGIFYMMVNIGGFIGPILSSKLRDALGWNIVFVMAASAIAVNIVLVTFFYKEPNREKSTDSLSASIRKTFANIMTALADMRLLLFLLIMVGFWTMFNQLFYTLPNFIEQWVDTKTLYDSMASISPALASAIGTSEGTIAPEMMVAMDAGFIIIFQIMVSAAVMKLRPINGIITGILVVSVGIGIAFSQQNALYILLGIFVFSIGEMASSPKFSEYVGKIAPKGKEALYMGTSFLPVAAGNFITGFLSGNVYESWSDKIALLKIEVASRGLEIPEISKTFTQNDYVHMAEQKMGMSAPELTNYLWNTYNPEKIWVLFSAIGAATILGLILYDKFILKNGNSKK